LGLAGLQFLGLGQEHDLDADADVDLDIDADLHVDLEIDAHVDIDAHLDAGLDVDHDLNLDHQADLSHDAGDLPAWLTLLHFLGVGEAPLTMVLLILLGVFGFLGWLLNSFIAGALPAYPNWAIIPVCMVALTLSGFSASRLSHFIGRLVPAVSTTATTYQGLVGRLGYVSSAQISEKYGQVNVRDQGGTLITVFAVVDPGASPIQRDEKVFLVEYDQNRKVFVAVPAET